MMTEMEKAAAGMLYDANYDEELILQRQNAKYALYQHNRMDPRATAKRKQLLKNLLGKTGDQFLIEQPFYCDYGYNIEIGENFYSNFNLIILDGAKVTIGNNAFIAPNVGIYTAGHPMDAERRNQGLEYALPVTIGDNVWISAGVSILPGVTIGSNSVIGAGSVVVKNIPANVLAAGNPCRVIREINEIDKLKFSRQT